MTQKSEEFPNINQDVDFCLSDKDELYPEDVEFLNSLSGQLATKNEIKELESERLRNIICQVRERKIINEQIWR